jgi:uncharacterized protein YutE (UPF0331/DUF86 family)
MVKLEFVARKIATANSRLEQVDELLEPKLGAFVADLRGRDLTAFYLQLAIQDCIDLASHWVAEAGWPPPEDAGSAFDTLADRDVISRDLATFLRDAVSLRNRIAHGYATVDHERLYKEARDGTPRLKQFLAKIADAAGL